jgi:hypothetical protein
MTAVRVYLVNDPARTARGVISAVYLLIFALYLLSSTDECHHSGNRSKHYTYR